MSAVRRPAVLALGLVLPCLAALVAIWADSGFERFHAPVVLLAVAFGLGNAVLATGIVLVYRSSRVINFAHAGAGLVGAALFYELLQHTGLSFWLAFPAGVLVGGALGGLIELLVIRRFTTSPRLVLTVVTIGLAQLLAGLAGSVPALLGDEEPQAGLIDTPFSGVSWQLFPVRFRGDHVAAAAVSLVALIGLVTFLTRSRTGTAIRGAAENDERASLLGVNTRTLSTVVWAVAGLLSSTAAVLSVMVSGYSPNAAGNAIGAGGLLLVLAAAVIGGMDDLPVTVIAAIGLSVLQQVVFFVTNEGVFVDAVLLLVLGVTFLLRRRRLQRTDEAATSSWSATEEVRPVPKELAGLAIVKASGRRVLGVLGVVVLGYPFVASPSQVNIGSLFVIYGIVMVSLVILTGWGGQVSLGQFAFVAVGAAATAMLAEAVPFPIALLLGSVAGAAVAVLIGLTALRVRGLYLAVTTLAFAVAMGTVGLNRRFGGRWLPDNVERPQVLFLDGEDERVYYYLCLVALGAVWWAALGLRRSRTGRVLIALRENERAAESYGINVVRSRLATFALSGFFAAFAGGLLAAHQRGVSPEALGSDQSTSVFLTAVIGGLGSIQGALLGGVYLGVVNLAIPGAVGRLLAGSLGVLLVLMFFPSGLGGMAYAARDAVLRRIAIRRRIHVPSLFGEQSAADASGKAKLAPRPADRGAAPQPVPTRYRLPSRIRMAGASQSSKTWDL